MMESTPESGSCHSVCTLCLDLSLLLNMKKVDGVASHTTIAAALNGKMWIDLSLDFPLCVLFPFERERERYEENHREQKY